MRWYDEDRDIELSEEERKRLDMFDRFLAWTMISILAATCGISLYLIFKKIGLVDGFLSAIGF